MKTRTREIARVGVFGSIENPVAVRESDLKEIAETFPEQKSAPIKLGSHYTIDRPRLGKVTGVKYDAKRKVLYATIEENDVLAKAVDEDGYYPDVSIGAKQRASDGKMYLHHLAYLGDEPPAIKDLEQQIAKDMSDAEKLAASDAVMDITVFPATSARKLELSDSSPNKGQQECKMDEQTVQAMKEENKRLKADIAAKEKLLSDTAASQHASDKEDLRKAAEGKVTQPQMDKLMALADSFEPAKTIELSDSAGNKKTERPLSILADIFAAMSTKVTPGEMNLSDSYEMPSQEKINYTAI